MAASSDPAPRPFDNLEEFTAIVVENVYLSETGATQLRGGHGDEVLPQELMPGKAFYDKYQEPLRQICQNHPALVRQLQEGKYIPHNPFVYCKV